ncbi:PAS domain-containing sensor histidine kinase [Anabaena azotica]|uniref:histidine kinase n=1 Tax=Anabaena azotica FACHB-119 TaxID=947527 RepID=A0ABR8D1D6_9NOST|nr:PAS domain S-box protein [Anabaena azotica]MBD2500940.1 PAS domain S-box protein [Anabaena azotica FACHB-119]
MIIFQDNLFAGRSKGHRVDEIVEPQPQQQHIRDSQATEAQYQAILNAIPDPIFRISRDGHFLPLSKQAPDTACSGKGLIGKNLYNILPTDVATLMSEIILKTLDTGILQACEYQLSTPLGIQDYEARLVVSGLDEVLVMVRDITERKQTEIALRNLAQKFSTAFNCSPDPISISTLKEGRYIEVNDSFVKLSGYERDEVIDRTTWELNIWVNEGDRTKLLQELQTQGLVRDRQIRLRCKSGKIITVQVSAEVIELDGIPHILAVTHDITERQQTEAKLLQAAQQQAELYQKLTDLNANLEHQVQERTAQLEQKMQELAQMQQIKNVVLHTVAHDLRTSVIGNLMVLENLGMGSRGDEKQSPVPNPQSLISVPRSIIDRMIQGNKRQMVMLDSLLEIHSCQEQGLKLHCQLVPFGGMLETAIAGLQPLLNENQATFTNLLPQDLPLVMADQERLEKVLINLFTYSLHQNPPGLNFTLKATVEDGMIRTYIQDNGVTMSQADCDRLFDLEIRDPQSPCSTAICLRMYLCRQIIQAHGGQIAATNHPQQGLTFWFTLPFSSYSRG